MDGGVQSKPYVGWCGNREPITPGDPILSVLFGEADSLFHKPSNIMW